MSDDPGSGSTDEEVQCSEETQINASNVNGQQLALRQGNDVIPTCSESQLAMQSSTNQITPLEAVITGGNFEHPVIGPQTNKISSKVKNYNNPKIIENHYHFEKAGRRKKSRRKSTFEDSFSSSFSSESSDHSPGRGRKHQKRRRESLKSKGERQKKGRRKSKVEDSPNSSSSSKSSDRSPRRGRERQRRRRESLKSEEYTKISKGIYMYNKSPLRRGTKIYKGYQLHASGHRRPLAIKMIVPCDDTNIREVEHLIQLSSHPNVVQIIHSAEKHDPVRILYIAMELCGKQNLNDYLIENRKKKALFNFRKAMSFAKQIVEGTKHIHQNQIIHRDLKPENLLLSEDGQHIKISDFGISKQLQFNSSVTRQSQPGLGTDGFRSPEAYNNGPISLKSDIFSLGLILYSLFSNGEHVYGSNLHLQNNNIVTNQGCDLSKLLVSGMKKDELLDLILQTLQPDPSKRPTIREVANHAFFKTSCEDSEQANLSATEALLTQIFEQMNEEDGSERERSSSGKRLSLLTDMPSTEKVPVSSDEEESDVKRVFEPVVRKNSNWTTPSPGVHSAWYTPTLNRSNTVFASHKEDSSRGHSSSFHSLPDLDLFKAGYHGSSAAPSGQKRPLPMKRRRPVSFWNSLSGIEAWVSSDEEEISVKRGLMLSRPESGGWRSTSVRDCTANSSPTTSGLNSFFTRARLGSGDWQSTSAPARSANSSPARSGLYPYATPPRCYSPVQRSTSYQSLVEALNGIWPSNEAANSSLSSPRSLSASSMAHSFDRQSDSFQFEAASITESIASSRSSPIFFVDGALSHHLLKTENTSDESILMLEDFPEKVRWEMVLTKRCLVDGNEKKAREHLNVIEWMTAFGTPGDIMSLVQNCITQSNSVCSLILLQYAVFLFLQDPNMGVKLHGIWRCAFTCTKIIKQLFEQGGRMREISQGFAIAAMHDMLKRMKSINGNVSIKLKWEVACLNEIGVSYHLIKQSMAAVNIYEQARDALANHHGADAQNFKVFGVLLRNIGVAFGDVGRYTMADEFLSKALESYNAALDFSDENERELLILDTRSIHQKILIEQSKLYGMKAWVVK